MVRKAFLKHKASSDSYISYLKSKGMRIGDDVKVYVPSKTLIDEQYPWMIEIGNNVRIAQGAIILTHDYSWYVLKRTTGAVLGSSGKVKIGNNVFIGMNAIITAGVTIGNNVIIGTGSVVTKDCEADGVYAGNPARKLMSLDEFYNKRKERQFEEAKVLAKEYFNCYGKKPQKEIFHEYFMLFTTLEQAEKSQVFTNKLNKGSNKDFSVAYLKNQKPIFDSFDEFIKACFDEN